MTFADLEHRPLGAHTHTERSIAVVSVPHRPPAPAAVAFRTAITGASRSGIDLPPETSWLPSSTGVGSPLIRTPRPARSGSGQHVFW
jgi:hypothetical protein